MSLQHTYDYVKSPALRPLVERIMGRSIVWAEGSDHHHQRQVLAPVYTLEKVKMMDDKIHEATNKMVDKLRDLVDSTSSKTATTNIISWTSRATLDVLGSIGFGYDFQCGESPEAILIQKTWAQMISTGMQLPGFVAMLAIRAFPWMTRLPVKAIKAPGGLRVIVRELGQKIVEEKRAAAVAGEKSGEDLLSTLLTLKGGGVDVDHVLDQVRPCEPPNVNALI